MINTRCFYLDIALVLIIVFCVSSGGHCIQMLLNNCFFTSCATYSLFYSNAYNSLKFPVDCNFHY